MRYIQIFVSSTFSDMHRERDLLHQIEGLINRDIAKHGYQITLMDMRYGIDTASIADERTVEKKVLSECFDAIDKSRFFVLLLGDRYGSVFEDLSIPQKYMPGCPLEGKSVTHLEVEYGTRKIEKDHIIIFQRSITGDISKIPSQYREQGSGAAQNRELRNTLENEGYYIDTYTAQMQDGKLTIDEYLFIKHGQGLIEDRILRYIKALNTAEAASPDAPEEVLGDVLLQEINKKTRLFPEAQRKAARALILLRIQSLLHQEDYDAINRLGGGGDALQEYRRSLIAEMPEDILALLQEICTCVRRVAAPETDVFGLLQLLACAQGSALAQMGGISLSELLLPESCPEAAPAQTLEAWLEFRSESSGMYRQQLPEQRALTFFLNCGLLTHTENGYFFKDAHIVKMLQETSPKEHNEATQDYIAHIFWYLPDPIQVWIDFLSRGRYDLALSCLVKLRMDERFSQAFLTCEQAESFPEQLIAQLEGFLLWMTDQSTEEVYLLYILEMCYMLADCEDMDCASGLFSTLALPVYIKVYNRFYDRHRNQLTPARLYLLQRLYDDIAGDAPDQACFCTPRQQEELDALSEAICELFFSHDFSDAEELKEYRQMVKTLAPYTRQPEQLARIIRMWVLHSCPSWDCLCQNLALMTYEDHIWDEKTMLMLLSDALKIHGGSDSALTAVEGVGELLAQVFYGKNKENLCIRLLNILYDTVTAEALLRRTEWFLWSSYVSPDVVGSLCRHTEDPVVREINSVHEDFWSADLDDLREIDESLLKKVEEYYKTLPIE